MTPETAKPKRHGNNAPTTVADIAAHKDTIAAFGYTVSRDGVHTLAERHGIDHVATEDWTPIAAHVAAIGAESLAGEHVRVVIGDAQVVWYVRDGRFAVVAVLVAGSPFTKSVLRMCRRALKTMAAAVVVEATREAFAASVAAVGAR